LIVNETTLSSKGQLVIPLEIRRRLGLKAGDQFDCSVVEGNIVLQPHLLEHATLEMDEDGLPVLNAPPGAPEMSSERVKAILSDFP
jgi:AbrB family looped-hinge helix DNA binding protein